MLAPMLLSCESKRDQVIEFFNGLGVKITLGETSHCLNEQLNEIYEEGKKPHNMVKIAKAVAENNLYEISLNSQGVPDITCTQAIISDNHYTSGLDCDPSTYEGSRYNLGPTKLSFKDGTFSISLQHQYLRKTALVYEIPDHDELDLEGLEAEMTKVAKSENSYIDIAKLEERLRTGGNYFKPEPRTAVVQAYCSNRISLEDIFKAVGL